MYISKLDFSHHKFFWETAAFRPIHSRILFPHFLFTKIHIAYCYQIAGL